MSIKLIKSGPPRQRPTIFSSPAQVLKDFISVGSVNAGFKDIPNVGRLGLRDEPAEGKVYLTYPAGYTPLTLGFYFIGQPGGSNRDLETADLQIYQAPNNPVLVAKKILLVNITESGLTPRHFQASIDGAYQDLTLGRLGMVYSPIFGTVDSGVYTPGRVTYTAPGFFTRNVQVFFGTTGNQRFVRFVVYGYDGLPRDCSGDATFDLLYRGDVLVPVPTSDIGQYHMFVHRGFTWF